MLVKTIESILKIAVLCANIILINEEENYESNFMNQWSNNKSYFIPEQSSSLL